jgi:hypothetical protein
MTKLIRSGIIDFRQNRHMMESYFSAVPKLFAMASGNIGFQTGSIDSLIYAYRFNQAANTLDLTDSIKTLAFREVNDEFINNGKAFLASGSILYSLVMDSGKFERVPGVSKDYFYTNKFVECNGKLYVYTKLTSTGTSHLCTFDAQTLALTPVFRREQPFEPPLCYGSTLVGEAIKGGGSGAFVLYNGVDTAYYSSGQTSYSFGLSGSTLYWIGDGQNGDSGSLWKLNLSTISTEEQFRRQLDMVIYPTVTMDGRFSLSGTDGSTRLLSAQLVNTEGKVVALQTLPVHGGNLFFESQPSGIYFLCLVAIDGRRFVEKVVFK